MVIKLTARSIYELGKRTNQEDSIFPPYSPAPTEGSLFILCDGMGGHAAGEVASQTVCETMARYVAGHPREDGLFDQEDFYDALNAAYDALDAKDTEDEKKMGTTLTFVKFHAGGCFIAHIGDSRIYHVRPSERRILHVTRDHSLVNDLIKLGEMTPEEARTSRQKNVITRAVQPNQESRTKADCLNIADLQAGDYFYMCSDGMLEQAEDKEILNILSLDRSDDEKIEILRGATRENKDNHSAHLIRILEVRDEEVPTRPSRVAAEDPFVGTEPRLEPRPEVPSEPVQAPELKDEAAPARRRRWLLPMLLVVAFAICVPWGLRHRKQQMPDSEPSSTEQTKEESSDGKILEPVHEGLPKMGDLRVISYPPGAEIWLDGENTEKKTPFDFLLDAGEHRLKLVLEGYQEKIWTITVVPDCKNAFAGTLTSGQVGQPTSEPGMTPDAKVSSEDNHPVPADAPENPHVSDEATGNEAGEKDSVVR